MEVKTLSQLRKENDLSQRELAKKLDLTYGAIALYETGRRTPALNTAKKIAQIFGVPIESIYFGKLADKAQAEEQAATREAV